MEVGGVADQSLVGPGRVYVPGDDDRLDGGEAAERPCGVRNFIHNLKERKEEKDRCSTTDLCTSPVVFWGGFIATF